MNRLFNGETRIKKFANTTKSDTHKTIITNFYKGFPSNFLMDERFKPTLHRKLSPLEAERLMGFPDGYTKSLSTTQRYKSLGNAVMPQMVAYCLKYF